MKNTIRFFLAGLLITTVLASFAQDEKVKKAKEEKKAEKARIKKEKEEKENKDWLLTQEIAEDGKFVIEFNRGANGDQLNSRLNFFAVYNEQAVLQLETGPLSSTNGLGGITLEGTVTEYRYTPPKNDKKPIQIRLNITGKQASQASYIVITVYKGGNASLTLGSSHIVRGDFLEPEESRIFKGLNMIN